MNFVFVAIMEQITSMRRQKMKAPVLYLSHGSPMRVIEHSPAKDFLQQLPKHLPVPKGVLIISPHWETAGLYYTQAGVLETIHDFYGFPEELYRYQYAPQNPMWLEQITANVLSHSGLPTKPMDRGLDHGAWSVLSLMYPDANIPTLGLSLPNNASTVELFELGETLASLREQGIMIVTTGMATHNFSEFKQAGAPDEWAVNFVSWLQENVRKKQYESILAYREHHPYGKRAHPTDEHLRPLFITLGASQDDTLELLHDSWEMANGNNSSWGCGLSE